MNELLKFKVSYFFKSYFHYRHKQRIFAQKLKSMQLLDGRETAEQIRKELAEAVQERKKAGKKIPHLAAILVGNDGGSLTYVGAKVKACDQIGFESTLIRYDDSVPEEILLAKVKSLNEDKSIVDLS